MSGYYPAGSMRGSGIDSYDFDRDGMECEDCGWVGTATIFVNDWGSAGWDCPECEESHDLPDREEDDYDYDRDDYDRFR